MKKHLPTIILIVVFLTGLSLLLYPTVSDWWNSFHQSRAIASYTEQVSDLSQEERDKLWQVALDYNQQLSKFGNRYELSGEEEQEYEETLSIGDTGIMGYVDIPKINIKLPIYHGTNEATLQVAVGHIPGTSLPVGGESTHCVISGHRGLPSAKLFTDIDQLVEGDTFMLQTLDHTLTYEVDQIRTVLPTELEDLNIVQGEDYCTLVTCTPYGINTHRLLVRGHRVENAKTQVDVTADALRIDPLFVAPVIAGVVLLVLLAWLLLSVHLKKRGIKENQRISSKKNTGKKRGG